MLAAGSAVRVTATDGGPASRRTRAVVDHRGPHAADPLGRAAPRADAARRCATLGADTLRAGGEVERGRAAAGVGRAGRRFDATDPAHTRASSPTTTWCGARSDKGFRVLARPRARRAALGDGGRRAAGGAATGNREPDPREFARFAAAVGKRYSGDFEDLPEVEWFSLWNEPNHHFFLKPNDEAPRIYRAAGRRGAAAALRDAASDDAQVLVGRDRAGRQPGHACSGPREFLRRWLCLDERLPAHAATSPDAAASAASTSTATRTTPTGPTSRVPEHADIVSLLVIRRLGRYLDRAARGRAAAARPADLQHRVRAPVNPPDPTAQLDLARAGGAPEREGGAVVPLPAPAQLRAVPALRRPAARGHDAEARSGRASRPACASPTGGRSPPGDAYRLPIVVQRAGRRRRARLGPRAPGRAACGTCSWSAATGGSWLPARASRPTTPGYFEVRARPRGAVPLTARSTATAGRLGTQPHRQAGRATPLAD